MSSGKNVFLIGAGFIGWNVLDLLVSEGYEITTLARRETHAQQLRASGAAAVVMGTLDDRALITEQASKADIIIHTATADHLPSVEAVLEGIKAQVRRGGGKAPPIFLHTSGTSVLDDGNASALKSETIYRDDQREALDAIPASALHREIDLAIVKAQEELGEKAKFAIMTPPLIYGYNPKHERLTIQIPILTRFAMKHGYAGYVGPGLGVESNIHVHDLARGYIVLLHHLETSAAGSSELSNPYYFCESTGDREPSWKEVGTVIAEGLYQAGKIDSPEPREIPQEVFGDLFAEYTFGVIGLNSRSRAVRLRELGWEAKEKDWKRSYLEDELPQLLKEDISGFKGYTVQ